MTCTAGEGWSSLKVILTLNALARRTPLLPTWTTSLRESTTTNVGTGKRYIGQGEKSAHFHISLTPPNSPTYIYINTVCGRLSSSRSGHFDLKPRPTLGTKTGILI